MLFPTQCQQPHIPFNTSSLTCVSAWNSESFILRYSKVGPSLWNFVLLASDISAYIAIDFSPNGRMIGSSVMAGWVSSSVGVAKHYSLGGYTSTECQPDQGSLPLVKGSSLLVS
ncbi:cytochrome b561 and DOMON domain-containing protein [Canna indica]|uniref:Cytochrome b561 and DOMON domain-containing protein n=1 Tax=Canna indica TaxID=4628 RepID=A0AAQ3Q9S6_9LILI|nr:cytochrome b561 and DOMON domain-containing protein [Canna indica]